MNCTIVTIERPSRIDFPPVLYICALPAHSGSRPPELLYRGDKNYAVDLFKRGKGPKENRAELEHFLRPTKLIATGGIVKAAADDITKGAKTDVEKAHAIY